MKLYAVTVCHMEPEIIAYSVMRFWQTTEVHPHRWVLVDNRWPLLKAGGIDLVRGLLDNLANDVLVVRPKENLGGHGGFNAGLEYTHFEDDDLILLYDPDSNPRTEGWLEAMVEVMGADKSLAYVSLSDNRVLASRERLGAVSTMESISGVHVMFTEHPEMFNVTLFRGSVLREEGLKAKSQFYGHVETPMWCHALNLGMRSGYLYDYREDGCPIPHPPIYTQWKADHAGGVYLGNFDQYVKDKALK